MSSGWLKIIRSQADIEYAAIKGEFDASYYLKRYDDVRQSNMDPCLHYVKFGWKEGRDPAPWFNTALYLRNNRDVREARINPFYHFIKYGRAELRPTPTLDFMAARLNDFFFGQVGQTPAEEVAIHNVIDRHKYEMLTGEIFHSAREMLERVIDRGFLPLEVFVGKPEKCAYFLIKIGDECRIRGLSHQAEKFYWQALEQDPSHFFALQHLADAYLDRSNFVAALKFYRMALAIDDSYVWTHLNIAKSLFGLDRYAEALREAKLAHDLDDSSFMTRDFLTKLAHAWGNHLIRQGFSAAKNGDITLSHRFMNEAVTHGASYERQKAGSANPWNPDRQLKIAILADDALPQCLLYRVKNKVYQLEKSGVSAVWLPKGRLRDFLNEVAFADIAIFYRVPGTPEIVDAIRQLRAFGKQTYYEIDDLIFSPENYPEPYESYANLISRDQYGGLAGGAELFRLAMRECDIGVASTAPLAEHMRAEVISGDVIVVPNALGALHQKQQIAFSRKPHGRLSDKKVHIFYGSGTLAHKSHFEAFAAETLAPLLEKYPCVHLTLMGTYPSLTSLARYSSSVTVKKPIWDYEAYLTELSRADINIAVLPKSVFNDCKSEIKWLEAALFGIPSVLSVSATYELAVQDGETGFLCSTPEEWMSVLGRLVEDASLRKSIGQSALRVVNSLYNAEKVGSDMVADLKKRIPSTAEVEKRKLRVVVVNVFYPPQAIGGATRVVQENVDSLIARYGKDIEVSVFTTSDAKIPDLSIHEYVYNSVHVTSVKLNATSRFEWQPTDDRMKGLFAKYLDFHRPDIVHFHCIQRLTGSVVEAAREAGIPYVITVHDGWWLSDHQFLCDATGRVYTGELLTIEGMKADGAPISSIERTIYLRQLLADAAAVLSVSAPFAKIYRGVGLQNVHVVENGTIVFEPIARDLRFGTKIRVGFIGGLAAHKGFDLISEIWLTNRFDNIELVLVDHSKHEMDSVTVAWNENPVTIVGRTPQNKIDTLYASLDVLLAPSIWPESFGLVTREAVQAGLWVVASDRGSIGDVIIEGSNGFVVDVSTVKPLETVLKKIDQSPEIYRRRTGFTAKFSTFDEQVDRTVEIYKSVTDAAGKPIRGGLSPGNLRAS